MNPHLKPGGIETPHPFTPFVSRQVVLATRLAPVREHGFPTITLGGAGTLPAYVPGSCKIKLRHVDDRALPHELFHWVYDLWGIKETPLHCHKWEETLCNLWQATAGEWTVARELTEQRMCIQLLPRVSSIKEFETFWEEWLEQIAEYKRRQIRLRRHAIYYV